MYVIGVDYGTDSVRALVIDARTGEQVATAVHHYKRWKKRLYCDPSASQFRQHPLDYLEGLEKSLRTALRNAGKTVAKQVIGISVDTTGSTPVAVDKNGTPLSLLPDFKDNPNAMFILWKDHTANKEALEINELAHRWETDFTKYVGGIYSSEWFWAKILRTLRVDEQVRQHAFSWVEHCDWISGVLVGNSNPLEMKRSRCAAGHKAMWHEEFDGLPSEHFLMTLDPLLAGLRGRLYQNTYTSDVPMGNLSATWAKKLGLSEEVVVGVGTFDAHAGGVGAAIEPYALVRVMGTSTCDMLIAPNSEVGHLHIKGICGQVNGSIVPNMLGMEAGQSAFGDVYAWFKQLILSAVEPLLRTNSLIKVYMDLISSLSTAAAALPVTENDPIALDWFNGRRTPDANHTLKGAIVGLNLGSDASEVFKALVEATAFGAKAIVDRFNREGVTIQQVIGIGGVSKKSPFVMQVLADVLNMPIKIVKSDQACALGAAMYAATAAGFYPDLDTAKTAMSSGFGAIYTPNADKVPIYEKLYAKYLKLGRFTESEGF